MSTARKVYSCYTCNEEITFHGTRIRYNLDGSLHLCKPEDKLAYEKYHEYIRHEDFLTGWRLTGEDFWKWKREIYDVQRWTQSRDYYNELKEQREREQQRASAEAEAEERRKRAEAEAQRRKAAEEAAEEQRREEQRKQAAREKRRAARQRRKQREQAEAEAAAKEAEAREREHQAEGRRRRRSRSSRSRESSTEPGGMLEEALKITGLTVDILRLSSKDAVDVIKKRFRTLAMKFHPDRGGDISKFIVMNEAYEFLLHHLLNKI
jgi:hypothetical protein